MGRRRCSGVLWWRRRRWGSLGSGAWWEPEAAVHHGGEPGHHGGVIQGSQILEQGFAAADLHGPLTIGEQPPEARPLQQVAQWTQQRGVLAQKILHLPHQGPRGESGSALAGDQAGDLPAQFIIEACRQPSRQS